MSAPRSRCSTPDTCGRPSRWSTQGLIDDPVMVQLCMGIPWGAPRGPQHVHGDGQQHPRQLDVQRVLDRQEAARVRGARQRSPAATCASGSKTTCTSIAVDWRRTRNWSNGRSTILARHEHRDHDRLIRCANRCSSPDMADPVTAGRGNRDSASCVRGRRGVRSDRRGVGGAAAAAWRRRRRVRSVARPRARSSTP